MEQHATTPLVTLNLQRLELNGAAILGPIELMVPKGQTLALVGPSGVGKTSLLRIIAGLEQRQIGTCTVSGRVAVIFQEPTLMPWRSLRDNIVIPTGVGAAQADQALLDVGLEGRGADFPNQLSLGQQRRLSLARAFAAAPDVLLMDEPFVSLDPALADEMMTLFATLRAKSNLTTILVTHVEEEARRLADRIVTLDGSPGQIISDVSL